MVPLANESLLEQTQIRPKVVPGKTNQSPHHLRSPCRDAAPATGAVGKRNPPSIRRYYYYLL